MLSGVAMPCVFRNHEFCVSLIILSSLHLVWLINSEINFDTMSNDCFMHNPVDTCKFPLKRFPFPFPFRNLSYKHVQLSFPEMSSMWLRLQLSHRFLLLSILPKLWTKKNENKRGKKILVIETVMGCVQGLKPLK